MNANVRLAFIGAGNVNFGSGEGPWDHASRFEQIPGVECVGVADVDLQRAQRVIAARREGTSPRTWTSCRGFEDWRVMLETLRPDAAVVGLPPDQHGHTESPRDVEMTLARLGIPMLVEKPLGNSHPDVLSDIAGELQRRGSITSIGYMFRYSEAVARMRSIFREKSSGPCVFLARYNCAYSGIKKEAFWDVRQSGGPIVEQATHFLDLARYLCGEVELDTIQVTRISAVSPQGRLADIPTDDAGKALDADIPDADRIPRTTLAQWRFSNGAVGQLAHGVLLHQRHYEAELEVWADGVRCVLLDPYGSCRLSVRLPGNETAEVFDFNDDPYLTEDLAFIDAVRRKSAEGIRSPYLDALETYRLSWAVTDAM
jgi:predicted dehydrogenase